MIVIHFIILKYSPRCKGGICEFFVAKRKNRPAGLSNFTRKDRFAPQSMVETMKKTSHRLLKNLAVLASVSICIWCAAAKFQSWAREEGADALLFAAGMKAEASENAGAGTSPAEKLPAGSAAPSAEGTTLSGEEDQVFLPDDGIVPFHNDELPGVKATPDPARNSAPVEEIQLDGGAQIADFFVKDTTDSGTDLNAELQEDPEVHIKADGSVEVLIYHTHTSEAYSKNFTGFYYTDMETRTQNQDMSVVAVGEELKKALEAQGIGVVHDTTVNDTLYNGSYSRSWEVLQNNLEQHPGIQVTIDLHRDSMTTQEGVKYKPTVLVDGRKAAQVMFLAGCDADGGWGDFPDWKENLHLILRAQQAATQLYPDLVRPLNFSNSKYNMNATKGSMLIEVGTEVNTISEAKYSGRLLGEILGPVLKSCE